jgi:hypothetical protein
MWRATCVEQLGLSRRGESVASSRAAKRAASALAHVLAPDRPISCCWTSRPTTSTCPTIEWLERDTSTSSQRGAGDREPRPALPLQALAQRPCGSTADETRRDRARPFRSFEDVARRAAGRGRDAASTSSTARSSCRGALGARRRLGTAQAQRASGMAELQALRRGAARPTRAVAGQGVDLACGHRRERLQLAGAWRRRAFQQSPSVAAPIVHRLLDSGIHARRPPRHRRPERLGQDDAGVSLLTGALPPDSGDRAAAARAWRWRRWSSTATASMASGRSAEALTRRARRRTVTIGDREPKHVVELHAGLPVRVKEQMR